MLAIALGPLFLRAGYAIPGVVFGAAGGAYILCCLFVVPLLILGAGRLKFVIWQLATLSLSVAVIADNLRLNAIRRSDIGSVFYVFWALGTLLSSPLPIYFLLRPMPVRQRYIAGIAIAAAAVALWLGLKRITR